MPQSAEHVLDHDLFRDPEYQEMLANKKKMFENPRDRPKSNAFGNGPRPGNITRRTSPARR